MVDNLALFGGELQGAARFTRGQSAIGTLEGSSKIWREGRVISGSYSEVALLVNTLYTTICTYALVP